MSEPLNTYTLTHHLNFVSDGTGIVQIDEPIGFDGANFVIEQDKSRYGRDISFAGEEIGFKFSPIRVKYGQYFEKLVEYHKIYGYEAEVQYILKEGLAEYVVGLLDFQFAETDLTTTFSTKIIQNTSQALIKRRYDVKVDLFSEEDLDGEPITPVSTSNILLKAKPITQRTQWSRLTEFWAQTTASTSTFGLLWVNPLPSITINGIENELSFITRVVGSDGNASTLFDKRYNFGVIDAVNDITNPKLLIENFKISLYISPGSNIEDDWQNSQRLNIYYFLTPTGNEDENDFTLTSNFVNIENEFTFLGTESVTFGSFSGNLDRYQFTLTDLEFNLPNIPRGFRLSLYYQIPRFNQIQEWNEAVHSITGTSTAIDSVTSGVRLVNAMDQVVNSINQDFTLDAPRFENGGEWYDQFIFDGNLIRGRNTEFTLPFKGIHNFVQSECNGDYESTDETVFIGKYDDFYTNNEITSFLTAPDETFKVSFNERYAINKFTFKYKTYNQDKDDDNTIDAVHTEHEYLLPNKQVENFKDVEVDFIRDPFMLETTRKKSVQTDATVSLSQDDKIFIVDVVPLAPSTLGGFTASLTHNVNDDGDLQLLNDTTFNWSLLGFGTGATFTLVNTTNAGDYTVTELTNNVITLTPVLVTPTSIGQEITEVSYPYTNVQYTLRTNEGFDSITGVLNGDNYANLLYTPKRNIINNWGSYLATSTLFKQEDIRQTYFKNDVELVTQFNGGDVITENTNITQDDLPSPIVSPYLITTKVLCDFTTYKTIETQVQTTRGFIRVFDNQLRVRKIYPQKNDFKWADNVLEITGEERYESQITTIDNTNGYFIINEVGYDTDIVPSLEYVVEDDYIQFFDVNTRPITNKTRYDFVSINGTNYNSINELIAAI